MLNVKAVPCKQDEAIVLMSKGYFGFNEKFTSDLRVARPYDFKLFFELAVRIIGFWDIPLVYSFRRRNPKSWYRFLKFCKKDGRIKVYRKNNKMVYEVPTYFEE